MARVPSVDLGCFLLHCGCPWGSLLGSRISPRWGLAFQPHAGTAIVLRDELDARHLAFGDEPTADSSCMLLPANEPELFGVTAARKRIAVTDEEHAALTAAARKVSDEDRYPLSPRLVPPKSALAKLDPAHATKPKPEPKPPLPEAQARSRSGRRARR